MNAASDDESGSSAADSQVWSAGRHSDRIGDPVDSTGTSSSGEPWMCEHDGPAERQEVRIDRGEFGTNMAGLKFLRRQKLSRRGQSAAGRGRAHGLRTEGQIWSF